MPLDRKQVQKPKVSKIGALLTAVLLTALLLLPTACPRPPEPVLPLPPPPTPPPPVVLPPPTPPPVMKRLSKNEYPFFEDHFNYDRLNTAVEQSLNYLKRLPPEKRLSFGPDQYSTAHVTESLSFFAAFIAQRPSVYRLNRFLRDHFLIYQAAGRDEDHRVLFTGYYEPTLPGSRFRKPGFSVPVHSRPTDLVQIDLSLFAPDLAGRRIVGQYTGKNVVPYPDRSQLRTRNDLNQIAPPLAWLRDEVDLFILQIQGSGRIDLGDGSQLQVRYDGSNGRPYRSVGRMLIAAGKIKPAEMSMQAIRAYLRRNPAQADAIMDHNPRYIFFRKARGGPYGALGEPVTAGRSIAVDRSLFPSAALTFIQTRIPDVDAKGRMRGSKFYRGFALAQDAGNAIKGPGRADIFWGHGRQAEMTAGHLKNDGILYFMVLNPEWSTP